MALKLSESQSQFMIETFLIKPLQFQKTDSID